MNTEALFLIFVFMVGVSVGFSGTSVLLSHTFRGAAIERGYALYCPMNGKFAWVGECNE